MTNPIDILNQDAKVVCSRFDPSGLSGKTVLVTGASGLIGVNFLACLCNIAQRLGISTLAVMRSNPEPYLRTLLESSGARILRGDICNDAFLESLPQADVIIHAAGYAQPGKFTADPISTIKINTTATMKLLGRLRAGGKFLFVSTSELYSGLPHPPYRESQIGNTEPTHPRACYIEGKRCGEAICNGYRQRGVAAKSARLCLAYGPGSRLGDKRALYSFIERALSEHEIRMMDHGEALRAYCYVSDAIYMMWRILLDGKQAVYNVGGNSQLRIFDVASKIGQIAEVPLRMPDTDKTGLAGAPETVVLDISRFEQEFHPVSFIPMDVGLPRTVAWVRSLTRTGVPSQ